MKPIPAYFQGSSNPSPNIIIAAIDSTNALNPSHAALTTSTCEPCNERINVYITPIYPIVPTAKFSSPPFSANFL